MTDTTMETTIDNVKAQLMYEWDEQKNDEGEWVEVKGKQVMGEDEAIKLIAWHMAIVKKGHLIGSYPYYIADQIRKAESS